MTAEKEDHQPYFHPDGEVAPIPMPAQIVIRTDKSLGKLSDKVLSSLSALKKHEPLYSAIKTFQKDGYNVFLQAKAHKGVILTAILIGTGIGSGVLVKRARERQKRK